jgi:hypothetical protein
MSDAVSALRLQDAWRECERHAHHLCRALGLLKPLLPLTGEKFESLSDAQIQVLDQLVLRFTKLQDAMGGRLYPALLDFLQEPYEERPMLDKLNRLEKLGYLADAQTWQYLRNIRNKFTHDYPEDLEKNAVLINLASESVATVHGMLMLFQKKLKLDHPAFDLGRPLGPC